MDRDDTPCDRCGGKREFGYNECRRCLGMPEPLSEEEVAKIRMENRQRLSVLKMQNALEESDNIMEHFK
jgi:hypothetical protein